MLPLSRGSRTQRRYLAWTPRESQLCLRAEVLIRKEQNFVHQYQFDDRSDDFVGGTAQIDTADAGPHGQNRGGGRG